MKQKNNSVNALQNAMLYKHLYNYKSYMKKKTYILIALATFLLLSKNLLAQTLPNLYDACYCSCTPGGSNSLLPNCGSTSPYYFNNSYYTPNQNTAVKIVRVNLIFLHKTDGTGGYDPSNPDHNQLWDDVETHVNSVFANLDITNCGGTNQHSRIQFEFHRIYYVNDTYYWDITNNTTQPYQCPARTNWYMLPLQQQIDANTSYEPAIDVFFAEDQCKYNQWVLGIPCSPFLNPAPCSMYPSATLADASAISMPNSYSGYVWMRDSATIIYNQPWSVVYGWVWWNTAETLCHELGHSFALGHQTNCTNIMNPAFGPVHNYLDDGQLSTCDKSLHLTNIRRFIKDCAYSSTDPMIVSGTNTWDIDIKMYEDIIVPASATMTITCKVLMPEGGKIIVESGGNLILDGAILESACSAMWGGIEVQDGGTLTTLNGTIIQDAQYGITANNNSSIYLDNTIFNCNYVGVFVPEAPTGNNIVSGYITGCTFKCDAPLHGTYPGQFPIPGTKTFAGIQMNDISFKINGGSNKNTFRDLHIGIFGNRSSYYITECFLLNIQPDNFYGNDFAGSGVYVSGGHGYQTLKQVGFGSNSNSQKSFQHCRFGVYSESMNNTISNNYMYNVNTGVRVQYCSYRDSYITSNLIYCDNYGVSALFNDAANHLTIGSNFIYGGYTSTGIAKALGIYVNEFSLSNNNSSIFDNHIFLNNAKHGISIHNVSNASISYNTVSMISPPVNQYAITLQGCKAISVSCNGISSSGISASSNQRGIFISNTTKSTIICNNIDNTYHGIRFDGNCGGTFISGNHLSHHADGLYCGTTSIVSPHVNNGNTWNSSCLNFDAIHTGNFGTAQFGVNPFASPFKPATISPASGWFYQSSGTPFNCSTSQVCIGYIASNGFDPLDLKIARGEDLTTEYTEEMKYAAEKYLFEKLSNDNALLNSDPDFQSFFNLASQGNTDDFKNITDGADMLFNMTVSLRNQIDQNKLSFEQNLEQIKLYYEQVGNSNLTSDEIDSLIQLIKALEIVNDNLTVFNKNAFDALENNRVLSADGLKITNDGILTNANYDENEKLVNQIYLETIAKENYSFSPSQAQILLSIATQCPYSGGNAVFKARGIHVLIDPEMEYDDENICLNEGVVLRQASHSSFSHGVYEYAAFSPNPANNFANISFEFGKDIPGQIEIFNLLGQNVSSFLIPANEQSKNIDVSSLGNGIYTYTIKSYAGFTQKGKLVITR